MSQWQKLEIPGVVLFTPKIHQDDRGFFSEVWNSNELLKNGIRHNFVQDNLSYSKKNVLRGLHFQTPNFQAKWISVVQGEILDVAVDLRKGSPTFAKNFLLRMNASLRQSLFLPAGLAHGFYVLSEEALVSYKVTEFYDLKGSKSLRWNDPELKIEWPSIDPLLSERDSKSLVLREISPDLLMSYSGDQSA